MLAINTDRTPLIVTTAKMLESAITAHTAGNFREAEKLYLEVLNEDSSHPDASHNLGVLKFSNGELELAIPLFETALKSNQQHTPFWTSLLNALILLDRGDQAAHLISEGRKLGLKGVVIDDLELQLDPGVTSDHAKQLAVNRLLTLNGFGRFKDVIAQGEVLASRFPAEAHFPNFVGSAHHSLGCLQEAMNWYETAIGINADFVEAISNKLNLLYKMGHHEEALVSCEKLTALRPRDFSVPIRRGHLLRKLGRPEDAVVSYDRAIELGGSSEDLFNSHGNALKDLKKIDAAILSYKKAIKIAPNASASYNNLGLCHYKLGEYAEAISCYKIAINISSKNAAYYSNLGSSYYALEQYEEAIYYLQKASDLNPDSEGVKYNLANSYRAIGKYKKAILFYKSTKIPMAKAQEFECLYLSKRYQEMQEGIKTLAEKDQTDIRTAAISAFAAGQLGIADPYPFCKDPLDFILTDNLFDYNSIPDDFLLELIEESENHQLFWQDRTTKYGFQTHGNIFIETTPCIARLEKIIRQSLDGYFQTFKNGGCVLIDSWPEDFILFGWYNRLGKNGYQTTHIHPSGWVSGCIYLQTVDALNKQEGGIELTLQTYDLPIISGQTQNIVHVPKDGDIVIFPSSLPHRTLPFSVDRNRCVIAFDLMPVKR